MNEDPRDCAAVEIRADGSVGFVMKGDMFYAAWNEELLSPEQYGQAVKEVIG